MHSVRWPEFQKLYLQDQPRYSHLYGGKDHPRVILDNEQRLVIKLFYPKKFFSSDKIWPYAKRFKYNSKKLTACGITCPTVEEIFTIAGHSKGRIFVVTYPFLSGENLRNLVTKEKIKALDLLAIFVAHLHALGIFFRSIHLANILFQSSQMFALLDINSMRFYRRALSIKKRARNLKHLLFYSEDKEIFDKNIQAHFIQIYLKNAGLKTKQQQRLVEEIFS